MRYFIGNWKMFGVPKSINILNKINSFYSKDKNRNKYRVIITPPYTLIESFSKNDSRSQYYERPVDRIKGANACRNYGFEISKEIERGLIISVI